MIEQKKFKIKNMHCTNCEKIIERRIKSVEGVKNIRIDYATETGEVMFDSEKTNIKDIFKPAEEDGYKFSLIEDETPKKMEEEFKIKKLTIWKIFSFVLLGLLIISIYTEGFGFGKKEDSNKVIVPSAPSNLPSAQPNSNIADINALVEDDAVKGNPNAPVTIVEWSDFECPFCVRFYKDTLFQIEEKYIDTGKVKLVYRDFPLNFHLNAQKAAEAAECAGEQGKFWEMHDLLFEKGVAGGVQGFKQYAQEIRLDTAKFSQCLDSGKYENEVQKDTQDGINAGIQGTPGFIINGQLISGAQPFSAFQQVIERELAK